jgi:hypothetical protein
MKDIEIQNIINEYTLKLQMKEMEIKHKDQLLQMLQANPPEQEPNIKLTISEKPKKSKIQLIPAEEIQISKIDKKETTMDLLKRERKNAITIENFIDEFINNPNQNPNITTIHYKNQEIKVLKSVKPSDYSNGISFAVKQICKLIDQLPHNQRPIYCSDERRRKFYIFTNNGWIKSNDENSINQIIEQLIRASFKILQCCLYNITKFQPKNPFLCIGDYEEELEKKTERALTYKKELEQFQNTFCKLFRDTYKKTFYDWIDKNERSKITIAVMCDNETMEKATDKLKIQLSSITTIDKKKYIEEKETAKVESDSEIEYDNENDEEWD